MAADHEPDHRSRADWLADMLAELIPRTRSYAEPRPGAFGGLVRASLTGLSESVRVVVALPQEELSLTVTAPDRPDVMAEAVALACDTALTLLRCFPAEAKAVRDISFDRSHHGSHRADQGRGRGGSRYYPHERSVRERRGIRTPLQLADRPTPAVRSRAGRPALVGR